MIGILLFSVSSCGLIIKIDVECLCNVLFYRLVERYLKLFLWDSFKVYYECFGKCKGIFYFDNYNNVSDKCI